MFLNDVRQPVTTVIAACGNGICDNNIPSISANSQNVYEDKYMCPSDCELDEECGDGLCSNSESCFTCPSDCGTVCIFISPKEEDMIYFWCCRYYLQINGVCFPR